MRYHHSPLLSLPRAIAIDGSAPCHIGRASAPPSLVTYRTCHPAQECNTGQPKAFGLVYRCSCSFKSEVFLALVCFSCTNFSLTFDLLLGSLDQVIRPLRRSPGGALPAANMSTAQYLDGARVNIPSELSAFSACSATYVHVCVCEAQIAAISAFTISSDPSYSYSASVYTLPIAAMCRVLNPG